MRRLSIYAFVITLTWMCFIIAIAFVDAPARFEAISLKKPWTAVTPALQHAVAIGSVSFHKLNLIEWICCVFSWLLMFRLRAAWDRGSRTFLVAVTVVLAAQTWMLCAVLDERVRQIIVGNLPPETWHHSAYIAAEGLKVILLGVISAIQIESFARAVISE